MERGVLIFLACLALSFIFAVTWVTIMVLTLPESDGMHGQNPFHDPLVLPVMSTVAFASALLVFPPTLYAFKDRPIGSGTAIIALVVLLALCVTTPVNSGIGFFAAYFAYGVGLIIVRSRKSLTSLDDGKELSDPVKVTKPGG